jgi:hypothetical protein
LNIKTLIEALAVQEAGWRTFDGTRALLSGDLEGGLDEYFKREGIDLEE